MTVGRERDEQDPPAQDDVATGRDPGNDAAVGALRAEPEPEWADAIRRGRRSRAERLREVFSAFDDEDAVPRGEPEEPGSP
jgi:hypothetical protein